MGDHRLLMAGLIMAVLGIVLVGVIMYCTRRFQKKKAAEAEAAGEADKSIETLESGHPARRITPFWASTQVNPAGDGPRFVHVPGADMRIALRRDDGSWQFESPRAGFNPEGVAEAVPSPTTSSHTRTASRTSAHMLGSTKGGFSRKKGFESEYEFEPAPDVLPPPAYAYYNAHEIPAYTQNPFDDGDPFAGPKPSA
ncbi:hypothetical protein CYLTODRAFT_447710 [Cylindrobasidium torrendii FP15055 ss-10]|uniref:Uncharacterized protein n=1 Tax=Cylindrobasidium torrendii FP15055 ss-10 TaxID=1314674 RepID=A0A0D7AVX0_9AGAR|nr:hypothetical protein CYLTODRAFT_447710 [Cylindrobasidium torrendii FP15055 ss-10]